MSWNETNISIYRASVANNLARLEITSVDGTSFKYKVNGRPSVDAYPSVDDAKSACLVAIKTQLETALAEVNTMIG